MRGEKWRIDGKLHELLKLPPPIGVPFDVAFEVAFCGKRAAFLALQNKKRGKNTLRNASRRLCAPFSFFSTFLVFGASFEKLVVEKLEEVLGSFLWNSFPPSSLHSHTYTHTQDLRVVYLGLDVRDGLGFLYLRRKRDIKYIFCTGASRAYATVLTCACSWGCLVYSPNAKLPVFWMYFAVMRMKRSRVLYGGESCVRICSCSRAL